VLDLEGQENRSVKTTQTSGAPGTATAVLNGPPDFERLAEPAVTRVAETPSPRHQFELLLDKLPAGAYTCDADGLITYYNERAVAVWGRAPKLHDPVDRFCGSFKLLIDGEPIRHDDCWMARALKENRGFNGEEIVVEQPDGRRLTVLAHANPIHDEAGRLIGAVNVLVDITDRKRAEEALQQADRSKDVFLAKLAQEMRNQLGPTRGVLQVLRDGANGAAQEQARGLLQRQIEQVAQLVDNLVDIASINRSRMTLRKERIELGSVVRSAVRMVQERLDTDGHKIVVTFPNSQIYINADASRLSQAVMALVGNAVRYTERGGRIWLTAEQSGSHAVLSVRDTGIGIDAGALPQIFDMMTNMDRTVARTSGGLGIGLALVRGIVELHGGIIEARSDGPGHGSEFIVRLPVAV
jgi:PAS domain S-box-containing protein